MNLVIIDKKCCGLPGNLGYIKAKNGYYYCVNCKKIRENQYIPWYKKLTVKHYLNGNRRNKHGQDKGN